MRLLILVASVWAVGLSALAQGSPAHNWITPPDRPNAKSGRIAYYTGNDLFDLCQKDEFACVTYIQGAADGQFSATIATSRDIAYCIPDGSKAGQVRDVVVQYLRDNPAERHRLAAVLVARALSEAWPQC